MRGTLLNVATVAVGALLGLAIGRGLPQAPTETAQAGLGLVTIVLGLKMALGARSVLVVAAAVAIGGLLGTAMGVSAALEAFSEWARRLLGGGGTFNEAFITTSVLFCVGPMTLLGCLQDGLEGKIELLTVKALMDGICAVLFAATLGPGVLLTAVVVLVVQGALTLAARSLRKLAQDEALLADAGGAGGPILVAIGLGLAGVASLRSADFLPALVLAPLFSLGMRRLGSGSVQA